MRYLFWVICLFTAFVSCDKDGPYVAILPPVTSSGDNTMGFIYSDSLLVWTGLEVIPAEGNKLNQKNAMRFSVQTNSDGTLTFVLDGNMYIKQTNETVTANSEMSILIGNVGFTARTYTFDSLPSPKTGYVAFKNKLPAGIYYNMPHSFSLTVTHVDVSRHIISGTFSGTLFPYSNGVFNTFDSLPVQEGRFDAVYTQ